MSLKTRYPLRNKMTTGHKAQELWRTFIHTLEEYCGACCNARWPTIYL